ncbi:type II secretion system protein [Thermosipho atlanticus]|uniref:Prepilin-type N-terminal cleavage/methylation domain-containing protein n=1 Tax=Thermosipho atlanticus DSM 15807 TaxID=1123380 RepID=A0A1M5TND3_9BACT|nr:type II secretion system protein [Thermosipho atlanticus]SHH52180.1 prepilin-type N-terminal cleavage/methylation domain-containing protein [Thermosipho atlanticus DSM 15807]
MKKAFTLIELLAVIAIIAFLLVIVTPNALEAVKKAQATKVARNLRNILKSGETYINVEKPGDISNLSILLLKDKGYLEDSMKESDLAKYLIKATDLGNRIVLESVYIGNDVSTFLVTDILPVIKASGVILYFRSILGKWW